MIKAETYNKLVHSYNRQIDEIENLKAKIKKLEKQKEIFDPAYCMECENHAVQELNDAKFKLLPFEDEYFKGLNTEQIADLAKKAIRITTYNCELEEENARLVMKCAELEEEIEKGKNGN